MSTVITTVITTTIITVCACYSDVQHAVHAYMKSVDYTACVNKTAWTSKVVSGVNSRVPVILTSTKMFLNKNQCKQGW